MKHKFREKPWYPYTVALCMAVVLYVFLTHLGSVVEGLRTVTSFFSPVILGLVLAYLMNPLLRLFQDRVFKGLKSEKLRNVLSLVCTVAVVLFVLALIFAIIIPQLVSSISSFIYNLDSYMDSLDALISKVGLSLQSIDFSSLIKRIENYLRANAGNILDTTLTAGKSIGGFVVAFLLSVYVLAEKATLKRGAERLLRLVFSEKRCRGFFTFLEHSDRVLVRYIIFSLFESLIVATANAMFMIIMGMSYTPLVSFIVGITNLVPTFGPLIGGAIGAFILLLVKPIHALWFIVFTVVLQLADGYVIKPKIFGDSLGVSGLWILIAIVVGGKMFGVIGMLIAIPAAAILVGIYVDYLIPWLERRKALQSERQE